MILIVVSLAIYCFAIIALSYGFTKVKTYISISLKPQTTFTIVVPFRNEAEHLPLFLESILKLNYPTDLFEVILVDDESTEKFQIPNSKFQISIIENNRISNSPKKDAITTAMQRVTTDWVITTDADCIVPRDWLLTYDNYIQGNQVEMLAGAVSYQIQNSFLNHFQQLDLASLQGATIGSFGLGKGFMCNGANFGYSKSFFKELKGFEGNDFIASGDDVFLLQKAIAHSPEKVQYLKSQGIIITTKPVDDWKTLFHQRVRWASKTTSYQSSFGKVLGLVVFMGNFSLWFVVCGLLLGIGNIYLLGCLLLVKSLVDFVLIYKTNQFLKTKTNSFLISSLLYPFFCVGVALYSLFGKYEWKGRWFVK